VATRPGYHRLQSYDPDEPLSYHGSRSPTPAFSLRDLTPVPGSPDSYRTLTPLPELEVESDSDDPFADLPSVESLSKPAQALSSHPPPAQPVRPSTRRRRPTAKQLSQNRRDEEKQAAKAAKLKKNPKTTDVSQLDDIELPFRSSQ
jgi:hypothetical protein